MENNIEVMQNWKVKVQGRNDKFEAKVVMVAPNMIGLKEEGFHPQYYAPEDVTWIKCTKAA